MLIEDDVDDQHLFCEVMKHFDPMEIVILSNGFEAIEAIRGHAKPDIIFLDLNMPVMNGKEFITTVRNNQLYDGPIVILSTSSFEEDIYDCQKLGIRDFLTKPSNFSELLEMVASVLTGGIEVQHPA